MFSNESSSKGEDIINEAKKFLMSREFDIIGEWVEIKPVFPDSYSVVKAIVGIYLRPEETIIIPVKDIFQIKEELPSLISELLDEHPYLTKVTELFGEYNRVNFFSYNIFYKVFDIANDTMLAISSIKPEEKPSFRDIVDFIYKEIAKPEFNQYTNYFRIQILEELNTIKVEHRAINSIKRLSKDKYKLEPLNTLEVSYYSRNKLEFVKQLGSYILRNLMAVDFLIAVNPVRYDQLYVFFKKLGEI